MNVGVGWLGLAGAMLLGAVSVLGRRGVDIWPLFFAAQWALAVLVMRAVTVRRAVAVSVAWGLGFGAGVGIGAVSWGAVVPIGIALTLMAFIVVPFAAMAWLSRRIAAIPLLYLFCAGAWALWLGLGESVGLTARIEAQCLVGIHPVLVLGARIVGANWLDGIVTGGLISSAAMWVRSSHAPLRYRLRSALQPAAVAVTLLVALGGLARHSLVAPSRELRVGVPQVDADSGYYQSRLGFPELVQAFERRLDEQLRALAPAELIVFTEAHDGAYGLMLPKQRERWAAMAKNRQQALLPTSYLVEPSGLKANALGAFTTSGELAGIQRKVMLAPYGERALAAGSGHSPLRLDEELLVGALICNEAYQRSAVGAVVTQGANLLVASTSDVTFGSSVLVFEHLAAAQLQAVEYGRDMVWASNAGPSTVLSHDGARSEAAPFRKPAALLSTARLFDDRTPYDEHHWLWLGLSLLLAAAGARGITRSDAGTGPVEPAPEPPGPWRLVWAVATLPVVATVTVMQPVLVELRHGDPKRAMEAIGDLFLPKQTIVTSVPEQDMQGDELGAARAASFFARYYGAAGIGTHAARQARSLDEVRAEVLAQFNVDTRVVDLRHHVPRVASLLRLKSGRFVVATRPTDDTVHVFVPGAPAETWDVQKLLEAAEPQGLIPQ